MLHVPNVNIANGDFYQFDFGFDGSFYKEPPSLSDDGDGWRYKYLRVEFGNR